jgi:hypothetical protein
MAALSDPTLGLLIEIAEDLFTASQLRNLLMRSNLNQYAHSGAANNAEMLRVPFLRARSLAVEENDSEAHRALLKFIVLVLEKKVPDPDRPDDRVRLEDLREALLADGYELQSSLRPDAETPFGPFEFQLLPTDAAPVPLGPEISALESEMASQGYDVALRHYRQAVDNFANHQYEAANGQLRTTLEDLVTRIARRHGYVGRGKAGEGGNAINYLVSNGHLPEREGGQLLQGIWNITHERGSHPGRSDADEARFRMVLVTAVARFLLRRLQMAAMEGP